MAAIARVVVVGCDDAIGREVRAASHARLIVRVLLRILAEEVGGITVLDARRHIEKEAAYERANGYDALTLSFARR